MLQFQKSLVFVLQVIIVIVTCLEEKFISGDLDLIFSSKSPGRQKYTHIADVGYQTFDWQFYEYLN
jgi:hypothetical protein